MATVVSFGCLAFVVLDPQASVGFRELWGQYRSGDADRAVAQFAKWDGSRVTREARLSSGEDDPWSVAALALLHAEATPDSRAWREHKERARSLIEQVLERASAEDNDLKTFCRDWFLAAPPSDLWPWLRRKFADDPAVLLAHGKWLEYWMPRVSSGGPKEYGTEHFTWAIRRGSSTGRQHAEVGLGSHAFPR